MAGAHRDTDADPHAELHQMAAEEPDIHEPVQSADSDPDWKVYADKLNAAQTKRTNDLAQKVSQFQSTVSTSVSKLANDLDAVKTTADNNAASIQAQTALIQDASNKAEGAKAAAAAARQAADKVAAEVAQVRQGLEQLSNGMETLATMYETHTHQVSGRTDPPNGNAPARGGR